MDIKIISGFSTEDLPTTLFTLRFMALSKLEPRGFLKNSETVLFILKNSTIKDELTPIKEILKTLLTVTLQ